MAVEYRRCKNCGYIFEEQEVCPNCGEKADSIDEDVNVEPVFNIND